MATASETITAALREGNLLSINATPTAAQQTEGLRLLNTILAGTLGQEVGEQLRDLNVGGAFDQSCYLDWATPANARLVLNLSAPKTVKFDPFPYDGQRAAIVDSAQNLATYNLTIDANGRRIEDLATLTLNTNGDNRQWLYRADLGQWVKVVGLELANDLPFPTEFDDYFACVLAMRLSPRYGQDLQPVTAAWLNTISSQLEARYRRPRAPQEVPSPALLGQRSPSAYGSPVGFFSGRPWW